MVNVWNNLGEDLVNRESLNSFKNDIDHLFSVHMYATNFGDKIQIRDDFD